MGRSYSSEKPRAAVGSTKQLFIFHECYIQGHISAKCILPLRDQQHVIANYETLTLAERVAIPAAYYVPAKQMILSLELYKLVGPFEANSTPPIPVHCIKWAGNQISEQPSPTAPVSDALSQISTPKVLSTKIPSSGLDLSQNCPSGRYEDRKDDRRIFVSIGRNYKVYSDIALNYTCMNRLVDILDTRTEPSFIGKNKLPTGFETQLSFRPLSKSTTQTTIRFGG